MATNSQAKDTKLNIPSLEMLIRKFAYQYRFHLFYLEGAESGCFENQYCLQKATHFFIYKQPFCKNQDFPAGNMLRSHKACRIPNQIEILF